MNIIQKLTVRFIKRNKSISVVILAGIVLSVALMTSLFLFSNSVYRFFRDATIKKDGDSHIAVGDISRERLETLPNQELVEKRTLLSLMGVEKIGQDHGIHFIVAGISPEAMKESVPLRIVEGRLPAYEGEAVITRRVSSHEDKSLKIGQKVVIDLHQPNYYAYPSNEYILPGEDGQSVQSLFEYTKDRDLPITIVGIVENVNIGRVMRGGVYFVYQTPEEIESAERLWAGFVIKDISTKKLNDFCSGLHDLEYNQLELTHYYPTVQSEMSLLMKAGTYSLLVIVALVGVALIQNGFLISLSRRIRDLSVLSSIGMTRRQKWIMSLTEGLGLYFIGMPFGIVTGLAVMTVLLKVMTPKMQNISETDVTMQLTWDPLTLVIIAVAALVTLFIASVIPVVRTSQKSPLAGVRLQEDIKVKSERLKSPKIVSSLFGAGGEIAWKNMRRNRRRFRGALVVLVFSMVLFLTLSSLMHFLNLSMRRFTLGQDDIEVCGIQLEDSKDFNRWEALLDTDLIKDGYIIYSLNHHLSHSSDHFAERLDVIDGSIQVAIMSFDTMTLDRLLREWDVSREGLEGKRAVLVNQFFYEEEGHRRAQDIFDQAPSEITLMPREGHDESPITFEVAEFLTEGLDFCALRSTTLHLVVLPETLDLLAKEGLGLDVTLYANAEKNQLQPLIKRLETRIREENLQGYVFNMAADVQSTKDLVSLSSMIIYCFLAIIFLIVIANIYNTLSASLRSRRREFAVLRSVGMDERDFRRMLRVESFLYSLKIVFYGIPLAVLTSLCVHQAIGVAVEFSFRIPYLTFFLSAVAVVMVVMLIMNLGSRTVRKGNILDALKIETDM
ncbi:MAG: ABC transporter permease [Clostridiaceae bacterium]|nr:ABC transporter permease [Clostridia bacterium]NMA35571.1 ABC transporter permease [Clostridiaceae bacterium]